MRGLKSFCVALFFVVLGAFHASAETYPSRIIKIIVPWPAGGVADVLARIAADNLTQQFGRTVIVENRPGAGTNIGSELVARADPDGYTLLLASTNNAVNMTLYKNMRYDIVKDFEPISKLAVVPNILVSYPNFQPKTVKELIAYAKANPGKIRLAIAGNGSPAHLAGEQFKRLAQIEMITVPYKGAAPAVTDLMGGFVDVMFTNIPASLGSIKGGQLRAIGIGSKERSPALPDVPTIIESGLPNYEATAWYGLMAPRGTPKEVLERLSAAIQNMKTPEIKQKLVQLGTEPVLSTPDEMAAVIKSDVESYRTLIQETGIQID